MKAFLKQVVASFFGSCFSVTVFAVFVFFGIAAVIGAFVGALTTAVETEINGGKNVPLPEGKNILVIDLSRGFSDSPTFGPANVSGIFSDERGAYGLLDTLSALESARNDDTICGVLLLGGNTSGENGFASTLELRNEILRFRALCDKPVFAYLPVPSYKDYLLATAANEVWIHPFSELPLNGLASSNLYFKNFLENIGVGVQITRVGTHKSAVEPLISDKMSDADRAQRTRLTGTLWKQTMQHVFAGRAEKLASADAKNQFAQSLISASENLGFVPATLAAEQNFVDAALYEDEVIERLKTVAGTDEATYSFRQIALDTYLRARGIAVEPPLGATAFPFANVAAIPEIETELPPCVAVVYAEGEIVDGVGATDQVGGQWFSRALRELRNDDSVKAVVLRINSPGGSVFASEQIRREAELLAQEKTLVVSMGDVAASGGYWISAPAKKVFATPTTITGSIGVFGVLFNLENLGKKLGVASEAVLTGPLAELDTARRPKTPQEMAIFQKATERIYADFLKLVADARGMSVEEVDALAQGQVWSGIAAKEKNLIDEFGGLADAIAFAKKDAGLPDDAEIIPVPGEVNRFQELFDRLDDTPAPMALAKAETALTGNNPALLSVMKNLRKIAQRLRAFNDPNGLYARLPFDVDFSE